MASLVNIEGIGAIYSQKLKEAGIATTGALLKVGATPQGRKVIEERSGIGHALILEWVNLADLFRINGVGEEYSDLLEESGVDTVVELALRNPENLFQKMAEVNREKKLVRKLPAPGQVADWIEQAKELPRVITY